jgi:hypothetical protein
MKMGVKSILVFLMMIAIGCCLKVVSNQAKFTADEMESMLQTIDGYFFSPSPLFNM